MGAKVGKTPQKTNRDNHQQMPNLVRVRPPLDLDNPECQLIDGTVSERSLWAEKMAATHTSIRCSKHSLFHNWELKTVNDMRATAGSSYGIRFDAYIEVSPGKWFARDTKPRK